MKHRKPNWLQLSALAAAMALPGAGMAATFSADFFSAKGWVEPGQEYPFTISYDAEGSAAEGTINVTLPPEATFVSASVAPANVAGQTLTFELGANHGANKIIVTARASSLTEDPTIMWKNLSAQASYTVGTESLSAATLGPKVTTLESARYGKRPFPLVMVEYQDIHHCTGADERGGQPDPFLECTANHSAEALDEAVNSRTTGRSLWQLYQDMSFGQLSPEGQVGPIVGTADTGYGDYPYKFSTGLAPNGFCSGTTFANPATGGKGAPLATAGNRIVDGWYRLPGTQGYYGSDRTGHGLVGAVTGQGIVFGIDDGCGPTAKITYDAAAIADPELDYNEFDTDKDGVVDFFNVAFAGKGGNGNTGSGTNNVWPHKSDLQYYFTDENGETGYVSNDQLKSHTGEPMYWTDSGRKTMTTTDTGIPVMVRVGPYNVNPEAAIEKMSVIAHEYGHSLGLPDFYSLGNRETFGSWELMASDHSQFMTVFTRQDLGWIVPRDAEDGNYTLRESKTDTGEIHWKTPNGDPYTLTGPGIHNADALKFSQPTIKLIESVPSGVRAWHSGAGNDFTCPNASTSGTHVVDFYMPEFEQYAAGTSMQLSFQSLYEIEWDWDYAFLMVSDDGGVSWTALPSARPEGKTTITSTEYNPNANNCLIDLENGITGVSGVTNQLGETERALDEYPDAEWITDRFDLSAYAGNQGGIIIRFGYFTDAALTKRGWFIDDIDVSANGNSIYASDFEGSEEEHTRIFPNNFSRVSSSAGVDADHAYYVELRDRLSWDSDGKEQSERGAPTWSGGVAILYTDESHGYGNTGVDNPPAQTIVDSQPNPGDDAPNLDDAAYTGDVGRDEFNGCTHVDNYDTPDGFWKLPTGAQMFINGVSLASAGGTGSASVDVIADPQCDLNTAGPLLSMGAGYEDPDTNGSYQLTWEPTEGANGPNQLQEATNLATLIADDAEDGIGNWTVSSEGGPVAVAWDSFPGRSNSGEFAFFTVVDDDARNTSSIMTWNQPVAIPATGQTILYFHDGFAGELDDQGFVEVLDESTNKWVELYSTANPYLAGLDGTPPQLDPLGQRQVDLSAFAGQNIQLRFRYFVGSSNYLAYTPIGWWVDDVGIDTANWTDLSVTTNTSFVRSDLEDGHYYYRVRSSHSTGGINVPTNWSNIVEADVARENQAPIAGDDTANTVQGMSVIINVLSNDSDPDHDPVFVHSVGSPANGMASDNGDGTVTYAPNAGFTGTDTFTYTITDLEDESAPATVTVNVSAPNNTDPNAVGDSANTDYETAVIIDVLSNDSDPDGDTVTIQSVGTPADGTASDNGDGTVTYTPDAGFSGSDEFTYTITDGRGGSDMATVTVMVRPAGNTDPNAVNDTAETDQDTAVVIDVLANDSDADGDSLSVSNVSQGVNGSVGINPDNTVTYTPAAGYSGSDNFTYMISDGHGGSAMASVAVSVLAEGANHAPKAKDDKVKTPKNTPIAIYVLNNDKDKDDDALSISGYTEGENGTVHPSGDTLIYSPGQDFVGNDEFTYTVSDGHGGFDTAKVKVKVTKKDKDDDGSSDDQSSADDGSSDDHSSDDGSSRDDGCSKDADCDGISDASDDDDDNDGTLDEQDLDDDGDEIEDKYDSKGYDEVQGQSSSAPALGSVSYPLEVAPSTASIFVTAKGTGSEMLQLQITDSAGLPVGTAVSALGELTAFAETFLIGTYTITITNPTAMDIEFDYVTVRQQF